MTSLEKVLNFWFSDEVKAKWWVKDENFDAEISSKFTALHNEVFNANSSDYLTSADNSLAAIIVLDQFSRNMFRDKPESFAFDEKCIELAKLAIAKGLDKQLSDEQISFMYMPFMHSEKLAEHELALELFASRESLKYNLNFEMKHKAIIDEFGRYPHRNAILGRKSTATETQFLTQPNSSF